MSNWLDDLSIVAQQLRPVVQDNLLRQEHFKISLFLDTSDVRRAILGFSEYVADGPDTQIDVSKFNEPPSLAAALLGASLLGSFSMLPPHQSEFLRKLKSDQVFRRHPKANERKLFLDRIGIAELWNERRRAFEENALEDFLKNHLGEETEKLFKAVQCVRSPWWEQLKRLRSEEIFVASNASFDYAALIDGRMVDDIAETIRVVRGKRHHVDTVSKNDYVDAISLVMIVDLVRRFNSGNINEVPRFYDSSGLFSRVVKEMGLQDKLLVSYGRMKTSAIVSTEYLVYKASLRSQGEDKPLFEELHDALSTTDEMGHERVAVNRAMRELQLYAFGPKLKRYIDLSFLDNVWLKTLAIAEFRSVLLRMNMEDIPYDEAKKKIDATIAETTSGVLKDAAEFKTFSEVWLGLVDDVSRWIKRQHDKIRLGYQDDNRFETGLFRFGLPSAVVERATRTLEQFAEVDASGKFTASKEWHDLVVQCTNVGQARISRRNTSPETEEFVAAVLWAIGADQRITSLFEGGGCSSFRAKTIHAAALLRYGHGVELAEKLIEELQSELNDLIGGYDGHFDVLVRSSGIAYLWFHLWYRRWGRPALWRCTDPDALIESWRAHLPLITKALSCSEIAWHCLPKLSEKAEDCTERRAYITNQRLFYLVEHGDKMNRPEMDKAFEAMSGFRGNEHIWKPNYSDTLSRYFAYLSRVADVDDYKLKMWNFAKNHFMDAKKAERDDSVIREYGEFIELQPG